MPFLTSALAFLKNIPWQLWAMVIGAISFLVWLGVHDHELRAKITAERDAYWQHRMDVAAADFSAEMDRKRGEVSDLVLKGIADRDALEARMRQRSQDDAQTIAALKARRPEYVTRLADSSCTITRGFVVQFNAGADEANKPANARAPAAPASGPVLVDEPAGVSLSAVSDAITDTQGALKQCRQQVSGWQEFWETVVVPWYASLSKILSSQP